MRVNGCELTPPAILLEKDKLNFSLNSESTTRKA